MTKLPEEMSKGELLVELLHKGQDNLANSTKLAKMQERIDLLEQALREIQNAAESMATAAPEMQPLHLKIIEAAVAMALSDGDTEDV